MLKALDITTIWLYIFQYDLFNMFYNVYKRGDLVIYRTTFQLILFQKSVNNLFLSFSSYGIIFFFNLLLFLELLSMWYSNRCMSIVYCKLDFDFSLKVPIVVVNQSLSVIERYIKSYSEIHFKWFLVSICFIYTLLLLLGFDSIRGEYKHCDFIYKPDFMA